MAYTGEMVLPKNAIAMDAEEMRYVDGGWVYIVVALGVKASHYNAHHSYTKTVTRQGQKHKVTYKAVSSKNCYLCKWKKY